MPILVRDLMHLGVITCRANASLGQVAVMLTQHHVHSLLVIDRDKRPLGIISDFDLLTGEWLSTDAESLETMRKMTAGDLMSTPVNTVDAHQPFEVAAQRMIDQQIHRLIVTDQGKAVGVLSISDFVAHLAARAPSNRDKVADVMSDAMLVCRDKTPISAAARAMTSAGWRSVLVVNAQGKPLGMVSGFDLLRFCGGDNCDELTVSDVMHPPLTIRMDASLREAADLMIENHYHRLIVVDTDQPDTMPLGMISSFDIVEEMSRPGSVWQI